MSHAHNLIQNSWQDAWRARKISPRVFLRISRRVLERFSSRFLAKLFALAKHLAESLGLDYMYDSWQDSLRESFFLREGSEKDLFKTINSICLAHTSSFGNASSVIRLSLSSDEQKKNNFYFQISYLI